MVDFNDIVKVGSILLSDQEGVWVTETHQNNTNSYSSSNRDCMQSQDELQVRIKDEGHRICLLNKPFPANSHRILKCKVTLRSKYFQKSSLMVLLNFHLHYIYKMSFYGPLFICRQLEKHHKLMFLSAKCSLQKSIDGFLIFYLKFLSLYMWCYN